MAGNRFFGDQRRPKRPMPLVVNPNPKHPKVAWGKDPRVLVLFQLPIAVAEVCLLLASSFFASFCGWLTVLE